MKLSISQDRNLGWSTRWRPSCASRGLHAPVQHAGAKQRDFLTALAERVRDVARLATLPSRSKRVIRRSPQAPFAIDKSAASILPEALSMLAVPPGSTAVALTKARPRRRATKRHVILFLAANPNETTRLALDEECAAIECELRMATARDDFDFRSKWSMSVDDVMRGLNELQPAIIHFSRHGDSVGRYEHQLPPAHRDIDVIPMEGIQLQNEQRQPQPVSACALSRMIGSAAPFARLVVLNACFSDAVADALRGVVDCVVGMRGAIGDATARSFAVGFYRALGHRRSIGNAVEQAMATLSAKRLPDEHLPIFRTRDGVNAAQVTLA